MAGAELDGQVAAEVEDGGLGGRVAVGAVLAEAADAEAGDGRGDDDARRVADRRAPLEQRRELADRVEDAAHVEVHDLGKGLVRVLVKGGAPGRARVGKEYVDVVRVLAHRREQLLDAVQRRRVGGHRDDLGAGGEVGLRLERRDGLLARLGLARRDEDLGGTGLEESVGFRMLAFFFFYCSFPFQLQALSMGRTAWKNGGKGAFTQKRRADPDRGSRR